MVWTLISVHVLIEGKPATNSVIAAFICQSLLSKLFDVVRHSQIHSRQSVTAWPAQVTL